MEQAKFKHAIYHMQQICHDISKDKGFWDEERNFGEAVALMHSELSEALEAARKGNPESVKIPGFSHVEEELADLMIRVMDWAGGKNLRIADAILAKLEYNITRHHKHGKNF
jgi:NTP pyrophosphatase (non-canonical NTP hydrolase)